MKTGEKGPAEEQTQANGQPPRDLDCCPRCGQQIEQIVWGQTNCPRCGLHFECC